MTQPLLEFREVSKSFGEITANISVSFQVNQGSFHGIVGENGAGKSTIMKTLYGLHFPDSGKIFLRGSEVSFKNPLQAIQARIGMVHQHFKLVPTLSVWENIVLGNEPRGFFLKHNHILRELEELQHSFRLSLDLNRTIDTLPVGQQQQVEILKLLYRRADILILDEPTAVLTPNEAHTLLEKLREMSKQGKTVVLISHKLKEILDFTDFVTVMRQGRVVSTQLTSNLNEKKLASLIMGKESAITTKPATRASSNNIALEINQVSTQTRNRRGLTDFSLKVYGGEIVGIAGIEGQGQEELVAVLTQQTPIRGNITLLGEDLWNQSAYFNRQRGFGVIPPDRQREGLILSFTNEDNLILGHHREKTFQKWGWVSRPQIRKFSETQLERFDIRPRRPDILTSALSGGNQQKIIMAREAHAGVRFLLACHPSRGVDIGAMESFHQYFNQLKAQGAGILLISSDLDELCALSDRIVVLREGRNISEKPTSEWTLTDLGLSMTGATP